MRRRLKRPRAERVTVENTQAVRPARRGRSQGISASYSYLEQLKARMDADN